MPFSGLLLVLGLIHASTVTCAVGFKLAELGTETKSSLPSNCRAVPVGGVRSVIAPPWRSVVPDGCVKLAPVGRMNWLSAPTDTAPLLVKPEFGAVTLRPF